MKKEVSVEILSTPLPVPFSYAIHVFFVITDERGKHHRWEVWHFPNKDKSFGHIHKDILPPFAGVRIIPNKHIPRFRSRLIKKIEGEDAIRLRKVIESTPKDYPFRDEYHFVPGPNSNTYAQWILDRAGCDINIPGRAIGKNFLKRNSHKNR